MINSNITIPYDNTAFIIGNNNDIGIVKKIGGPGFVAFGNVSSFVIAQSNAGNILPSNTFTTKLSIDVTTGLLTNSFGITAGGAGKDDYGVEVYNELAMIKKAGGGAFIAYPSNRDFFIAQSSAASVNASNTFTRRITINQTSGNVLINTATDSGFRLDVNGTTRLNGNTTVTGSVNITGSLAVTAGVINQLTSSYAITASNANTASYIVTAQTASYVQTSQTASYVLNAQTASYVLQAVSASYATQALTASNANTASYIVTAQTASYVLNAISSSFASTASSADNFTVRGTLTAQTIVAQTVSSSIVYSSGSNRFGNDITNTQTFTGSVGITGSLAVTAGVINQLTSSFAVTSSFATTASYALNAANPFIQGGNSFGTAATLGTNDAQNLQLETNNTTRIFISGSGPIGIGTTSPTGSNMSNLLHLNGAAAVLRVGPYYSSGGDRDFVEIIASGADTKITSPNERFYVENTSGDIIISAAGKVGINTTTPVSGTLQVNGNVFATSFTGSLSGSATTTISSSYAATASSADNFTVRGTLTAQTIVVQTITSSVAYDSGSNRFGSLLTNTHQFTGSVLITGSSAISINGGAGFQASAVDINGGLAVKGEVNVANGAYVDPYFGVAYDLKMGGAGNAIATRGRVSFDNGKVQTDGSGNVLISGSVRITGSLALGNIAPSATLGRIDASNDIVAYSTSDIRFKTNIFPISSSLDKIKQISGVEFDWIPDIKHGYEGHDVGVIAQELEKVLPEVVTTRDNGYKAVKYEKIVPLLIEAIKEQQKQIDELRTRLG